MHPQPCPQHWVRQSLWYLPGEILVQPAAKLVIVAGSDVTVQHKHEEYEDKAGQHTPHQQHVQQHDD